MKVPLKDGISDFLSLSAFLQKRYHDKKIIIKRKKDWDSVVIKFTKNYSVEVNIYPDYIIVNYSIDSLLIHLLPTIFLIFFIPKAQVYEKEVLSNLMIFLNEGGYI